MTLVAAAIPAAIRRSIRVVMAIRSAIHGNHRAVTVTGISAPVGRTPAPRPDAAQTNHRRNDRITRQTHARLFPLSGGLPETRP